LKSIECTSDVCTIKNTIKDDYSTVIFDGCPSFEDFQPDTESALWFILKHNSETAGLIKLDNLNLTTWIPHIIIREKYRGNGSEKWGQLVIKYMQERLHDVQFLVLTPYESAKNYAIRMGFNLIGVMPKSIKKNGELMNQYILTDNRSNAV
jgi:hypothetical protein